MKNFIVSLCLLLSFVVPGYSQIAEDQNVLWTTWQTIESFEDLSKVIVTLGFHGFTDDNAGVFGVNCSIVTAKGHEEEQNLFIIYEIAFSGWCIGYEQENTSTLRVVHGGFWFFRETGSLSYFTEVLFFDPVSGSLLIPGLGSFVLTKLSYEESQ